MLERSLYAASSKNPPIQKPMWICPKFIRVFARLHPGHTQRPELLQLLTAGLGPSPTPTVHRRSRDDVDLSAGRGAILVPTATMKANSFDQLACAGEEYARDCVAERLGGLHVDDQINLRDLLHR